MLGIRRKSIGDVVTLAADLWGEEGRLVVSQLTGGGSKGGQVGGLTADLWAGVGRTSPWCSQLTSGRDRPIVFTADLWGGGSGQCSHS